MHKITTPAEKVPSASRIFSFCEPSQAQPSSPPRISSDDLNSFTNCFQRIQLVHNQCHKLSHFLIINSADVNAVCDTLENDGTLSFQLRERMGKYLRLVDCFDREIASQEHDSQQISLLNQPPYSNNQKDQKNLYINQSSTPNLQIPPSFANSENDKSTECKKRIESTEQNQKRLSTSRYTTFMHEINQANQSQPLQNVSIEIKKYQPQKNVKNLHSNISQSRSNKSISNSQVSQSRFFNKIQLKSVKKVGQIAEKKEEKQEKSQKDVTINANKGHSLTVKQDKKYTISHRDKKSQKSLSYQVNNMKSNSRLRASRIQAQQQKKNTFQSSFSNDNKARISSKSLKKHTLSPNRHQKCYTNQQDSNNFSSKLANSRLSNNQGLKDNKDHAPQLSRVTGNNIVYETVQKSTQFLQMLRMMGQE